MFYNIKDFGAVADGVKVNTPAIQSAIDECHKNGGGRVLVPSGTFVTGTIYLKSNVELHLEMGAVLKASGNFTDYNGPDAYPESYGLMPSEYWDWRNLIIAHKADNVAITGLGRIDGNGEEIFDVCKKCEGFRAYIWSYGFSLQKDLSNPRPGPLVVFVGSTNIKVTDITITNAPAFCMLLQGCENVQIRGYRCFNERFHANTDGIHIDTCRNVTISDCVIDTGDDAIALRCDAVRLTNGLKNCENVTITNCVLATSSSAIRLFGYEGEGHIRNVTVSNVIIHRAAKAFNLTTSYIPEGRAVFEDVIISNVVAKNVSFPIYMREYNNSTIQNVNINNFHAASFAGAFMISQTGGKIRNISINNMSLDIIPAPFTATREDLAADCRYLRAENGRNVFYLDGVCSSVVDCKRITIPEDLRANWDKNFYLKNCENVKI